MCQDYHITIEPTFSGTTELWSKEELWESGENPLDAAVKVGIIPLGDEEEGRDSISFLGEWGGFCRHVTVKTMED